MLRQRRLEGEYNGVRQPCNAESYGRSKDKDRSVAGGMRKGRLHQGKSEDIPQTGQRNSFGRAVCPVKGAVQEKRERKKDRSLIIVDCHPERRRGISQISERWMEARDSSTSLRMTFEIAPRETWRDFFERSLMKDGTV